MMSRLRQAVLLAASLGTIVGSGQAQQTTVKDPDMAYQYSLYVPGGGHFYTGEYVRAGAMLGVSLYGALQASRAATGCSSNKADYSYTDNCPPGGTLLWAAIMAAPYVYGIFDSRKSAERVNAKARAQTARFSPFLGTAPRRRVSLGLTVHTR